MKHTFPILVFFLFALTGYAQRNVIDLSGEWQFAIDRDGSMLPNGKKNSKVANAKALVFDDSIELPGSMPQRLKGDIPTTKTVWTGSLYDSSFFYNPYMKKYQEPGQLKLPFFLTPDRHYVGSAWYQRTVSVPASFKGKRVMLYLERPHITTTLYINSREVGTQNTLSVAHEYDITDYVKPGKDAIISILVNNSIDKVGVGQDSHSVTDQTQGNWNGLAGRIELQAIDKAHICHVDVFPNVANHSIAVVAKTTGLKGKMLTVSTGRCKSEARIESDSMCISLPLDDTFALWDEFHPNVYQLKVEAGDDCMNTVFGLRSIETRGKDIYVNGRPVMMRGTVENCDFPNTGYAPLDKASWMAVFRKCKEYGLNHMRFHSFCPPEAAFEAADELGFYLQPEGPSWPNHGVKLGNGMMIDKYLMEETQRIVEKYGNHPSFAMLSCGNEPAGNWVAWVSKFVDYWRATDSRRIYTGASVGGGWAWQPKNQYHVKAGARGLDSWRRSMPESMEDFRQKIDTVSQPFIAHEVGQWCVFPDFSEVDQYTGVNKAKNFEIFRDILADNGMASRAQQFLSASGKLQVLCYKAEMERMLRTPHYAGFQLLGLNDYSGQGSALVGPLNVFWREKGYVSPYEWCQSCAPITILARLPKFVFSSGEKVPCTVEVANYGEGDIRDAELIMRWTDEYGKLFLEEKVDLKDRVIGMGNCQQLADSLRHSAIGVNEARTMHLELQLRGRNDAGIVDVENSYTIWFYPNLTDDEIFQTDNSNSKQIYICKSQPDEKAFEALRQGGTVLVCGDAVTYGKGIVQQFTPVFWNTSWFKMKPPHTTGMYIEQQHPLFRYFPTEDWSDVQWWSLMNRKTVMLMDKFPTDFQPIVQPIDTWFLSRKLGMLFEANVEGGRLLMTTMPLAQHNEKDPVIRQMTYAIMKYITSSDFRPTQNVPFETIQALFTEETPAVNMFTKDSPDELKKGVK